MGQYSFVCSDTERALLNVSGLKGTINRKTRDLCTAVAYCLIPAEFGGGAYVVDHNYDGYGHFFDMKTGEEVDIYEKLANWNVPDKCTGETEHDYLLGVDLSLSTLKNTTGFNAGDYDTGVIKYPLKIVEVLRDYEKAKPCWSDTNQGYGYDDEIEDDDWEDTDED